MVGNPLLGRGETDSVNVLMTIDVMKVIPVPEEARIGLSVFDVVERMYRHSYRSRKKASNPWTRMLDLPWSWHMGLLVWGS